jgi:3',5'-cyclic AMP phosphodiesterase CpdA
VQPELGAEAGLAAALAHAQRQKPDLLITGGDSVMDVFEAKRGRAEELRKLLLGTLKRECSVPVRHTVGNHDIFGWNKSRSGTSGSEADWGKRFACDMFGTERTYSTFDQGGWRFVCLDSVQPKEGGYTAYLDDAQFEWLKRLLADTPRAMPVCVVSHIPILSLTTLTFGKPRGRDRLGEDNVITNGEMHTDATLLHELFKSSGNVKLCLSGHIHLLDRCSIDGVTYICDGAVSGSWWKGPLQGVPEGFGVLDLRPDGTFDHRYETYGWQARK